ncbi:S-DNA-T family DNA segregation ATPase FtsK/SpoIIIE [Allocatelliglobosispora scoriae]|uniref:S-DNA-T family DNA segregation ATPase FtsK/SpoIIIE n=1 Tax=Allocatelliglobosispora scoriae TaxID=643052 RepID=A0A841C4K5_9ACTN|nr:FtsK/SpoIIIE domain-containing protein [Allocatelliglobosispora scoriae]MBB5874073.1 S-DNA-T family DNA segregation ATPase FtsK/SpoIIIE [Allocatelliglobosispora scoriae]
MTSLKLTLQQGEGRADLAVTVPSGVTVGSLAAALFDRDPVQGDRGGSPVTLALHGRDGVRALDPAHEIEEAGLGSGVTVSVRPASAFAGDAGSVGVAGQLRVLDGPDRGRSFPLRSGNNLIGRDASCTVRLSDTQVSKVHASLHVGASVEIRDINSTNGVEFGGGLVSRTVLRPGDQVKLGNTVITVNATAQPIAAHVSASRHATQMFNRSPRLDPTYEGVELDPPTPPKRPNKRRFPIVPMLTPLLMGAALFMLTRSPFSLIFIFMSPMMVGGSYAEDYFNRKKEWKQALADFRTALEALDKNLRKAVGEEHLQRCASHPSAGELVTSAHAYGPLLWTRRPEHASFLELRTGLATLPSQNTIKMPNRGESPQEVWDELTEAVAPYATVDAVPVVAALRSCGALGVAGPGQAARRVARGIIAQLVTLHSPAELVVCAVMSAAAAAEWNWLKWLPHTSPFPLSAHTPLRVDHLTTGGGASIALLAALDDLIKVRTEARSAPLPAVVLLVSDDTEVDRGRLVDLAERGPEAGVHVIWFSANVVRLPAVCRTFVEVADDATAGEVGHVRTGDRVEPVRVELISGAQAEALAMRLSPVVDAGARTSDESDLPRSASFVTLAQAPVDTDPQCIIDRWDETKPGLRALVGALGTNEAYHLDLVAQGPHALLGGTTGAGKSELLQTWLLGMATGHDPRRVNFLLVDYKGGSAFGVISQLPHSVGMVTDLDPHQVRRALTSLRAELTRREHLVKRFRAKDLADMERYHLDHAPARLVIVVDEFAALKKEIPEFVDGMVDIGQRGRSLGLHLILATQRPTGVINDQLRANTNLRIALRMADAGDSNDVLGSPMAAAFDLDIPGRAAARTGPGRVTMFQAAYAGGWTAGDTAGQDVLIRPMPFGLADPWQAAFTAPDHVATDIGRIVATIRHANDILRLPEPFVPWRPELPVRLDLAAKSAGDGPGIVIGRRDIPEEQRQPLALFDPDTSGNLIVYGSGGSGKSTVLRSLALAAARGDAGPCHVYGIDFGNHGLDPLEALPQMADVVRGDDVEKLTRLLGRLQRLIDQRAPLVTAAQPSNLSGYWQRLSVADRWKMPRVLLLVDGVGSLYQQFPPGTASGIYERLMDVATRGRSAGVHLAMTTDRPNSVPGSLASTAQQRLVLRIAEADYNLLGIRNTDALSPDAPPGRALADRTEMQVGIAGGADVEAELNAIESLADALRRADLPVPAPVDSLASQVRLADLPAGDLPVIGQAYDTLEPVGFDPRGFFVVAGPTGSGRTTTLTTIVASLRRSRPGMELHLFSPRVNPGLVGAAQWVSSATNADDVRKLAEQLTADLRTSAPRTIIVESFPDLADIRDPQATLENLFKVCRDHGHFVVVEGDSSRMLKSDPVYQLVRARTGVGLQVAPALQYATIFGFEQAKQPKLSSPPPGRGLLVLRGQPRIVQIALPN